jgi:hypothetical protein
MSSVVIGCHQSSPMIGGCEKVAATVSHHQSLSSSIIHHHHLMHTVSSRSRFSSVLAEHRRRNSAAHRALPGSNAAVICHHYPLFIVITRSVSQRDRQRPCAVARAAPSQFNLVQANASSFRVTRILMGAQQSRRAAARHDCCLGCGWPPILPPAGTAPRAAMEIMRHSAMRLTSKTYTDAGLLPGG